VSLIYRVSAESMLSYAYRALSRHTGRIFLGAGPHVALGEGAPLQQPSIPLGPQPHAQPGRRSLVAKAPKTDDEEAGVTRLSPILQAVRDRFVAELGTSIDRLVLFGPPSSVGAESEAAVSEVDLMVVLAEPFDYLDLRAQTAAAVAELEEEYGIKLARLFVSAERFDRSMSTFMKKARRESVVLYPQKEE
jgi:hypothetical protein